MIGFRGCKVVGFAAWEPTVDGSGMYADLPGDLGFGETAVAEKRSHELDVGGVVKLRRRAPADLVLASFRDAGAGAFGVELALHLSEGGEDGEHGLPDGSLGVDAFGEADEFDLHGPKPLDDLNQVRDAAAEPVEAPHDEGVVGAKNLEEAFELRPLLDAPGSVIGVDAVAAGVLEGCDLQFRVLVDGGDAGVADAHEQKPLETFSKPIVSLRKLMFTELALSGAGRGGGSATSQKGSFLRWSGVVGRPPFEVLLSAC